MSLLTAEPIFKPFHYPWAYDAWKKQTTNPLVA